jgi:hypothetical protein
METHERVHQSEYLSITELCARIRYAPKSIYNMISQGVFKEGTHYFKPTKRKLLFSWPAMEQWIRGGHDDRETNA